MPVDSASVATGNIPVLPAWTYHTPRGCGAVVWCSFCSKFHWHGPESGHVQAHCAPKWRGRRRIDAPYAMTGYVKDVIGPADGEIMRLADAGTLAGSQRSRAQEIAAQIGRARYVKA